MATSSRPTTSRRSPAYREAVAVVVAVAVTKGIRTMIRYAWEFEPSMGFVLVRLRDQTVMRTLKNDYVSQDWRRMAALDKLRILKSAGNVQRA